ncbi:transposase family protein [Hymenobacter nivis]
MVLLYGIPSADTFRRVFQHLDAKVFHAHNRRFTTT